MDPTTTWEDLQREVMAGNSESASELAEALLSWLRADGFPPLVGSKDLPYGWHRALAEAGAKYVVSAASRETIDDAAECVENAADDGETHR